MSVKITFAAIRSNIKMSPPEAVRKELHDYTQSFIGDLASELIKYPPPVPGSRYERTFDLLKAWRIRDISTGDGIRYALSNSVTERGRKPKRFYSEYVHGTTTQSPWHAAHGWRTVGDSLSSIGGRRRFTAEAQKIINKKLKIGR